MTTRFANDFTADAGKHPAMPGRMASVMSHETRPSDSRGFRNTPPKTMKKLITIVASVLLTGLSVLAQGSIQFQNIGPGLNGAVRDVNGNPIAAGAPFTAELLVLSSIGFPVAFTTSTWVGNGWFGVGDPERVVQGFAAGSRPFLQVRVWDSSGGINSYDAAIAAGRQHGSTAIWQLPASSGGLGSPLGTPPVPAPVLFGMPGPLQLVPEPSITVLAVLCAAGLLLRRRKSEE